MAAKKALADLEAQLADRIIRKVANIRDNPFAFAFRLRGLPTYKLRIGDWRAILLIDKQTRLILVVHVGHRKNVYDNL